MRAVVAALGLTATMAGATSCTPPAGTRVQYVVDGDTVDIDQGAGRPVRVRLLGVDEPEATGDRRECWGSESTAALRRLLPTGTTVVVVPDPTQATTDRFGRTLAYVEVAGRDVGHALILAGDAQARDDRPPPVRGASYRVAADTARAAGRGLWVECAEGRTAR